MSNRSYITLPLAALMFAASPTASAAKPAARTSKPAAPAVTLDEVRSLFNSYRFADAAEALETYRSKRSDIPPEAERLEEAIEIGSAMLDRVEKIVVIDSITVDRDEFFRAYRLAPSSGSLQSPETVTSIMEEAWQAQGPDSYSRPVGPAYMSEDGDYMMWAASRPGDDGRPAMFEADLLADGSWSSPVKLFDYASVTDDGTAGSVMTPYLMSDGVTLYFAAEGSQSLGGLDIFISRRDGDRFLQPTNVGMPYNSPYDDYMLAIDETTGVGWWATDRNRIPDKVTIYRFIPSDLRVNYPPDTDGLTSYARLTSVAATHTPDAPVEQKLALIAGLGDGTDFEAPDFELAMPGGRVYTRLDDFRSPEARSMMEAYLNALDDYELDRQDLARLRERYRTGDRTVAADITSLERKVETSRAELRNRLNGVIRAEGFK